MEASQILGLGSTLGVVGFGGFAGVRYFIGYRRSGVRLYGAVTVATFLVIEAQIAMHIGVAWHGTFWLYHVQLLAGCLVMLSALVLEHRRGRASHSIEQLTISDVVGQLRAGQADSFLGLTAALEARDGYTLGHGERVGQLAIMIGQQMHLSIPSLRALATGAVLHDIGKIGVPDAVLHKQGTLTSEEYVVIREHPVRGDNMLAASLAGPIERAVVRSHHERWDGMGYPDQLAGEAIPLEARITAIADVYDALRSNRAYRAALTREQSLAMIVDGAGTQFDPACAAALLKVVDAWEAECAAEHLTYEERRAA